MATSSREGAEVTCGDKQGSSTHKLKIQIDLFGEKGLFGDSANIAGRKGKLDRFWSDTRKNHLTVGVAETNPAPGTCRASVPAGERAVWGSGKVPAS